MDSGQNDTRRPAARIATPPGAAATSSRLRRDPFGDVPSRGNDGLPRDVRAAGPTPDLRPRPPGGGTADHSDARVPGQPPPLRSSGSPPLAAAPAGAL